MRQRAILICAFIAVVVSFVTYRSCHRGGSLIVDPNVRKEIDKARQR
jgi:hypothetical protein